MSAQLLGLSASDIAARPRAPRFGEAPGCVKVGHYRRDMPVTMARMMENALDWEHLPSLHSSSFSTIELIDSGPWGWRASAEVAGGNGTAERGQVIELLLDTQQHCWVTTILAGVGEGNQIHTQAVTLDAENIQVQVDFYVPDTGLQDEVRKQYGEALSAIYRQLYDEDESMMARRQHEMQAWQDFRRGGADEVEKDLGSVDAVEAALPLIVPFRGGRFKLDWKNDRFTIFSVRCPHMLGPLDDAPVVDGAVTCPWHGYRFDVRTGACNGHPGLSLETPPEVTVTDPGGRVVLRRSSF